MLHCFRKVFRSFFLRDADPKQLEEWAIQIDRLCGMLSIVRVSIYASVGSNRDILVAAIPEAAMCLSVLKKQPERYILYAHLRFTF